MRGEFDGFFIILKKLGETLHYVSCFSLHYSRAPAASFVLYNRVQASLLQQTNYLKCTPARCRLCCFGYANYLLICFCLILSSRTGSTLHSHETWLFRKTIEVKTFIKLLCNIISKKKKKCDKEHQTPQEIFNHELLSFQIIQKIVSVIQLTNF